MDLGGKRIVGGKFEGDLKSKPINTNVPNTSRQHTQTAFGSSEVKNMELTTEKKVVPGPGTYF